MSKSMDLRVWIQDTSAEEFSRRISDEPGFLDLRDSSGDRFGAMHHAAALGRIDLIRMILEHGVSVDTPSGSREEYPDPEAERAKFEPGFTPLMCAAAHGQLATVRHLMSLGADPLKTDYYDGTALHSAAASGSAPIVNVLLAAGCDPDAECGYKANCEELGFYWIGTPLHIAAASDHNAAARALIGHGAMVDALGMLDERRPLHYAAAKGATSAVEVLLRAGADPSRPEAFHDQTPLHYAARGATSTVPRSFFAMAPMRVHAKARPDLPHSSSPSTSTSQNGPKRCADYSGVPRRLGRVLRAREEGVLARRPSHSRTALWA